MKNLTITLPNDTMERLKAAAAAHQTSVNRYVRQLITQDVGMSKEEWRARFDALMEAVPPRASGWKWNREEIYEERLGRFSR